MAFDLLSGETNTSNWSRGDAVIDIATSKAKKLPWLKIGTISIAALGAFAILNSGKKKPNLGIPSPRHETRERMTQEIPRESMREVWARDPAKVYAESR